MPPVTDPAPGTEAAVVEPGDLDADAEARPAPAWRRLPWRDLAVTGGYLLAAVIVLYQLWADPGGHALRHNPADQILEEWFLAYGAHAVAHGGSGLFVTHLLNAPAGVNLPANASLLLPSVLLTPVTLLFGAPVAYALLLTLGLAGTATSWYLLFSRRLGRSRPAAAVGGAFCGFAPGIVAQTNGHAHISTQVLVPLIVWLVLRLCAPATTGRRPVRDGVLLGLAVTGQAWTGAEVLLLTGVTLLLFGLVYAALAGAWRAETVRAALPGLLRGLPVAAVVAGVLLSWWLWVQLAGPQHFRHLPFVLSYFSLRADSWLAFPTQSLFADSAAAARLAPGVPEESAFLGLPLIVVLLGALWWLRRSRAVVAAVVTAVVMAVLSLGPHLMVGPDDRSGPAGPWQLLSHLPKFDMALPARYALAVIPLVGLVLAAIVERIRDLGDFRVVGVAALIGALLPVVPTSLPTTDRPPVPRFVTSGDWRHYVRPGRTLVPVPLPDPVKPDGMRWATAAGVDFAVPQGFFLGPIGADRHGWVGVPAPRPTAKLLADIVTNGSTPPVTSTDRGRARADLTYWKADCVVLDPRSAPNADPLTTTLDALLGPHRTVDDVRVWPTR
jgi:hypothetical protein